MALMSESELQVVLAELKLPHFELTQQILHPSPSPPPWNNFVKLITKRPSRSAAKCCFLIRVPPMQWLDLQYSTIYDFSLRLSPTS